MIQCKDIMTLPALARAHLVSGKSGLSNPVRWIYKPEDMNFEKWVHGNELLIVSTPVIKSREFDLMLLLKKAIKLKIAGMLLLVGEKYIEDISPAIISFSNMENFPIMSISGEIPLIDIFEEIGYLIAYDSQNKMSDNGIFSEIVLGNMINKDEFVGKCEEVGYSLEKPQQIFVIHFNSPKMIQTYDYDEIIEIIRDVFKQNGRQILVSRFNNNFVGMTQDSEKDSHDKKIIKKIYYEIEKIIIKKYIDCKICMGIGQACGKIDDYCKSYNQAVKCISVMEKIEDVEDYNCIRYYSEIGLYILMNDINNNTIIKNYVKSILGELIQYDKENNTDLINTLRCVLWSNGSILHASEKLHMHRNSVKYRINKIQEIIGVSLEDSNTKLELMNAILCMKLVE